jgi:GTP-binding protein
MSSQRTAQVALIGRPNVGKSTLFNRLTDAGTAIIEDLPGVTRDRQYGYCEWNGLRFEVVDTGGLEPNTDDQILAAMRKQTNIAIAEADLVVLLTDGRQGLLPQDHEIFLRLRKENKPFVLAINKLDSLKMESLSADFYAMGIDELFAISSLHGSGVGDLLDVVVDKLRQIMPPSDEHTDEFTDWHQSDSEDDEDSEEIVRIPRIAVVGKPNVGKSTLINKILGEERLLALPFPGTTRDAIDVEVTHNGKNYLFIDTAGIRRKKYIKERLEREMIQRAVDALGRCDVALFLIDAVEGVSEQDAKVAGLAHNRGRGVILVVNKWDLVNRSQHSAKEFESDLRRKLKYLHYAPVLFCSATTGLHLPKLFETIDHIHANYRRRVTTGELNRFFAEMLRYHPPPVHRGKPIKFYFITQARVAPPTFIISANQPEAAHVTYERFITNSLRAEFGFDGVPLRIKFRQRK